MKMFLLEKKKSPSNLTVIALEAGSTQTLVARHIVDTDTSVLTWTVLALV